MSEKTARAERKASPNGEAPAVEKRETLDDFISKLYGDDELADTAAGRIAHLLAIAEDLKGELRSARKPADKCRPPSYGQDDDGEVVEKLRVWDDEKDRQVLKDVHFLSFRQVFKRIEDTIHDEFVDARSRSDNFYEKVRGKVEDKVAELKAQAKMIREQQARGGPGA